MITLFSLGIKIADFFLLMLQYQESQHDFISIGADNVIINIICEHDDDDNDGRCVWVRMCECLIEFLGLFGLQFVVDFYMQGRKKDND